MEYDLSDRVVIGIASSALFDLADCDAVFREQGEDAHRRYQEAHVDDVLDKGVAFPFVRRLLSLNDLAEPLDPLVEVIILSRNDPDTGLRVMRSIAAHGLHISRAVFQQGRSSHRFIPALNMSLFLSANGSDVREAVADGLPAGHVLETERVDDDTDQELRIAFDFDGVLAGDSSERIYRTAGIDGFRAHERAVRSLKQWGLRVNDAFFLGGIDEAAVMSALDPHIFFDDQVSHLAGTAPATPSVHVPFGVVNAPLPGPE
ncbi:MULTISPECIES: 5'-nucleotidase [unclassified Streptomyces]|uniref:5'-nucleotidase n=1 Tax=unclassified Streptomyces TaxID=2593676 RepID=UPI00225A49B5|nr:MULTISPECIES: 5'-nucleotidase [unclassified Streptomyces]MCX4529165.1 5'-nucleotidase [Streptomyces sp. NBC_01551]MCX4540152.1 5'-nucleotidase [Streptomyces sp. NBC_01565]